MHELSLSESIIALVTEYAGHEGVGRVLRVIVDIARLRPSIPRRFSSAFPSCRKARLRRAPNW